MRIVLAAIIGVAALIGVSLGDTIFDTIEAILPAPIAIGAVVCVMLTLTLTDEWVVARFHPDNRWLLSMIAAVLVVGGVIVPLVHFGL